MKYSKPEISELPNAVTAIQAGESFGMAKCECGEDRSSDIKMTVPAYIADE